MNKPMLDDTGVILICTTCGRRNRVPFRRLAEAGTCGQCQASLPVPNAPLDIPSQSAFSALLAASPLPVVVDFWAPWCGPCRKMAPELDTVAESQAGKWVVVKINTEALPGLGAGFRVQSIPTMALFAQGKEAARTSGARPAAAISAWVQANLPDLQD